jgi:hypothetical protein
MAIDDKHPTASNRIGEWTQMRDTYKGERAVKPAGSNTFPRPRR